MENKYITFSPYHCGLCNVIASFEIAFSISYISNRKLVVPPNVFIGFLTNDNRNSFIDIWTIFDKEYVNKNFKCIDFYEVPEFENTYHLFGNEKSYTYGISNAIEDVTEIKFNTENNTINESHTVITSLDSLDCFDFHDFCQNREFLNISKIESKFIHFENNLFGHYWYHVYPGNFEKRNKLKEKINNSFKYKSIYYEIGDTIRSIIDAYNSIHIRRNDFLLCRKNEIESISTGSQILNKLKQYLDPSIPLYIATDEKDKTFFDLIKREFKVYFFDDIEQYLPNFSELEKTIMEQIICLKSEKFYGTFYSTYSSRINIMRGLEGKQSDDFMGLNRICENNDVTKINPWKYKENKRWEWCDSSHPQWKKEINGVYV